MSQGFWMKSRAPRRMASTASSTLPHAVITITGSLPSMRDDLRQQVQAFLPGGRVAGVVQVDQECIKAAVLQRLHYQVGGMGLFDSVAFRLQQKLECIENVRLIVCDQHARRTGCIGSASSRAELGVPLP